MRSPGASNQPWSIDLVSRSPVIVHVPHAGRLIPADVRRHLLLDDPQLSDELERMTDHHTDHIAALARRHTEGSMVSNHLSRLVVDPERFPDEREVMLAVGMGAVYSRRADGSTLRAINQGETERLLDRYFNPYAAAVAGLVDAVLEAHGRCTIIDLHSYPAEPLAYERDHAARRPGVCIGTDGFHTPPWLRTAAISAFAGVDYGCEENTPFAGAYVPARHFGIDPRVTSAMIEIRRDLYTAADGTLDAAAARDIARRLAGLLRNAARCSPV